MNDALGPRPRILLLAALLACTLASIPARSQVDWSGWEDCDVQVFLPDDVEREEYTTRLADHILKENSIEDDVWMGTETDVENVRRLMGECVLVRGTGTIEVTIELTSDHPGIQSVLALQPPLVELRLLFEDAATSGSQVGLPVGTFYRELLVSPDPVGRNVEVVLNMDRHTELMDENVLKSNDLDFLYKETNVVWTFRRLAPRPCSMEVRVTGDVTGTHAGDFAYFNVFKQGVAAGLAAGTALDESAHEALQGLTDFAQWATDFLEDDDEGEEGDGVESQEGVLDPEPSTAPQQNLKDVWAQEWGLSGTDTFGLSMVGVFFDGGGPAPAIGTPAEVPTALGVVSAMETLGSTFSLGATGRVVFNPQGDVGKLFEVDLSSLMVLPGAMDANFGGGKFLWTPGRPGSARLGFHVAAPGVIVGVIDANVYSEREYQDGYKQIRLEGTFQALEGAVSCQ